MYDVDGRPARPGEAAPTARPGPSGGRRARPRGSRAARSQAGGRASGWPRPPLAGAEHLGTLVLRDAPAPLDLQRADAPSSAARMVTALVLLFSRSVAEAEERLRGELLTDLLAGSEVDRARLRGRERRHQVDLDRPLAVARRRGRRRRALATSGALGEAASRFAAEHDGLGGWHEDRAVVVAPDSDAAALGERAARPARRRRPSGRSRVGAPGRSRGAAAVAAPAARPTACCAPCSPLGRTGEVSDPARLGLARLLLGHNGPAELDEFVDAHARPGPGLRRAPRDRAGRDPRGVVRRRRVARCETAERLHVHPNTVAQRLDRVGELLGPDWREPGAAARRAARPAGSTGCGDM